jgi:hypothetical protein
VAAGGTELDGLTLNGLVMPAKPVGSVGCKAMEPVFSTLVADGELDEGQPEMAVPERRWHRGHGRHGGQEIEDELGLQTLRLGKPQIGLSKDDRSAKGLQAPALEADTSRQLEGRRHLPGAALDKKFLELVVRQLARHLRRHPAEIDGPPDRGMVVSTNLLAEYLSLHGGVARRKQKEGGKVEAV